MVSASDGLDGPPEFSWVAAVYESEKDWRPLGAAVVLDSDRILTCGHVISDNGVKHTELWAAFPMVTNRRRRIEEIEIDYNPPVVDVAVLTLAESVPLGVTAAPLQCQPPDKLKRGRWWAFGFPDRDPIGNSASGTVGEALAYGWVRLDTNSDYILRAGFSGGGMWSEDFQAVVGVVGQAHSNGDGRAITLYQAIESFPGCELAKLTMDDWE